MRWIALVLVSILLGYTPRAHGDEVPANAGSSCATCEVKCTDCEVKQKTRRSSPRKPCSDILDPDGRDYRTHPRTNSCRWGRFMGGSLAIVGEATYANEFSSDLGAVSFNLATGEFFWNAKVGYYEKPLFYDLLLFISERNDDRRSIKKVLSKRGEVAIKMLVVTVEGGIQQGLTAVDGGMDNPNISFNNAEFQTRGIYRVSGGVKLPLDRLMGVADD